MAIAPFKRVLCANRGEIAIRVFRASTELGFRTIAIFSEEDRVHLHRYKADEAYLVGKGLEPVAAYLAEDEIVELAKRHAVDAIHPGYGLLSERASFARKCRAAGIVFIGPTPEVIEALGDKVAARKIAAAAGVPVVPGTPGAIKTVDEARAFAGEVGYPVMIKASAGGGGRGMRVVRSEGELPELVERARSEAKKAFGDDSLFLEKLVVRPKHLEVQILGDNHGNLVHLYERDCSVQRRHQKVVEYAPAWSLPEALRARLAEDALKVARHVNYSNAGTVEFLVGADGSHYFIEVNPRIQVEHTVTEAITGRDLVQAQIRIAEGYRLSDPEIGIGSQAEIVQRGVAIQVRVTAEDPKNDFLPDTGKIQVYRPAAGLGIRLDDGSGYVGARVSPFYDSLLAKITASGLEWDYARRKVVRSLREFRIRGVKTNLAFLENVLLHPTFAAGQAHTTFIDETPELTKYPLRRDRATRILRYIGSTIVNGHPTVRGKPKPPLAVLTAAPTPPPVTKAAPPPGTKQLLEREGPEGIVKLLRADARVHLTDTTWRDAHQSLLATRVRTYDLAQIAPATARLCPGLFSLEMWGGATFDVAYRFLSEDPWLRLDELRALVPNVMFQMLVRGANAVGYTNYPDDVVVAFIEEAAAAGMDIFRIFDALNDVDNMQVAIEAAQKTGRVVETAICYTGDVSDPRRTKYDLKYYVNLAQELVSRGTHLLCIKDMAGLLKPRAATMLVKALRDVTDVPLHLHMHDTSGNSIASYLAAIDAGVSVVDGAVSSMAGMTSQPSLSSLAFALAGAPRYSRLPVEAFEQLSAYWDPVRAYYAPFESGLKAPAADVYENEIPGGQYSNLRAQSEALGLGDGWELVKRTYADVNQLFGDIPKVTPSSKVVGDMAIWMVKQGLDARAVTERAQDLTFPESVIDFMRGSMGRPPGGFPEPLRGKILKGAAVVEGRPGASLPPFDWAGAKREMETLAGVDVARRDVVSYALYPKVMRGYMEHRALHGDTSVLPTPTFFYGLRVGEEAWIDIEPGKTLIVKLLSIGEIEPDGARVLTFEMNGQSRQMRVADDAAKVTGPKRRRATDKPGEVGAPMPGRVIDLVTKVGEHVKAGQKLLVTEAMKLETVIKAPVTGVVREIVAGAGESVEGGDLLVVIEEMGTLGGSPIPPRDGVGRAELVRPHAIGDPRVGRSRSDAPSVASAAKRARGLTRMPYTAPPMTVLRRLMRSQQAGLVLIIVALMVALSLLAGSHVDGTTGRTVNNFFNSYTLIQTATDASFIAIMAVGATVVIISGGIDLSVGSVYALAGVGMGLFLRTVGPAGGAGAVWVAFFVCVVIGVAAGALNGAMVVGLRVHPFIITLGSMWILRGIAFVTSKAESILLPESLTNFAKAPLGLGAALYPIPMLAMLVVSALGAVYLQRTVMGRHVFAVGGNPEASRFSGLRLGRIQIGVYLLSGLTAGLAAFLGASFYGSVSCGDATGYELYVIASAVVGGARLSGGRGSAINAMLGAVLIVLIRQSIRTLHLDQNYEWIIIGSAIVVAVVLDQASARFAARRLATGAR